MFSIYAKRSTNIGSSIVTLSVASKKARVRCKNRSGEYEAVQVEDTG